jgi:hypothetical protein
MGMLGPAATPDPAVRDGRRPDTHALFTGRYRVFSLFHPLSGLGTSAARVGALL